MRYCVRPIFNQTPGHRFWSYSPGDLVFAGNFTWDGEAGTDQEAAARAYAYFNRDERPNGANERSLSTGDLIEVRADDGQGPRYYALATGDPSGIEPVTRPERLL